ncbi:uncharacterized protein LOC142626562 [Castanea sativa]|uniref:uncharacterized protein LOC142626562 n=1 Tax=Castanea sativa TaxID=21020 RepID=UPI003F649F94
MFKVSLKLKKCKKMLSAWSKDHFGSVKKQIAQKKELLWKAEEASAKGGSHEVVVHLRHELNVLLDKENCMWSQRSRVQWLTNGDRNTSYFHGIATQRKSKNFIKGIRAFFGEWVMDETVVSDIVVDFYSKLFSSSRPHDIDRVLEGVQLVVSSSMNAELTKPYTREEVDITIKKHGSDDCPWP